jgi:hypothetical protein
MSLLFRAANNVTLISCRNSNNIAKCFTELLSYSLQLFALGATTQPTLDGSSELVSVLLEMYERMGDALALQYGGSMVC